VSGHAGAVRSILHSPPSQRLSPPVSRDHLHDPEHPRQPPTLLAAKGPSLLVTDRDLAEVGRDQAEAQCALKDWVQCKQLLDDARTVDPEGESEDRVVKARAEIAAALGDAGR
jgi:hypothetical protein